MPVRLLGMVPPETVEELYAGARVHLAPSFQEGQPLTVLEAMSHGCCIVASDIPAHVEVIGDAGVLYPVKDPAALADALRRVLADDDLRAAFGSRARARGRGARRALVGPRRRVDRSGARVAGRRPVTVHSTVESMRLQAGRGARRGRSSRRAGAAPRTARCPTS